jgi:hypothetical protein
VCYGLAYLIHLLLGYILYLSVNTLYGSPAVLGVGNSNQQPQQQEASTTLSRGAKSNETRRKQGF